MDQVDEILPPISEEEALEYAVKSILKAASHLCFAAELAEKGYPIDQYINTALHLRDMANVLSPGGSSWPSEGADIYDIRSKQKLN